MSMALTSRGFVWFVGETMFRRINLISFICQSAHFYEKRRVLSRAISTFHACQSRYSRSGNGELWEKFTENREKYQDTFGDLDSFDQMFNRIQDDPEDIAEYQREKAALGKTIGQYIKEIKSHLSNHDYESAIKVLEVDMVNDRKRLCPFIYKVLINYNAKIGNLEEAYRLFIRFKKRQGIVTGAMYTSMFNACANCKNSLLAIDKAQAVEKCMRNNKHHKINSSNYNVMLKAFGRHGDIATCLEIMDEILEKRDRVHADTYSFLLQACRSDRNSGLRYALIVWRKMLQNLVKPDIYLFNTLLACVEKCSLGDVLLLPSIIEDIQKECGVFYKRKVIIKTINNEKRRRVIKIPVSGERLTVQPVESNTLKSPEKNKEDYLKLPSIESSQLALESKEETSDRCSEISQKEIEGLENELTNSAPSENSLCESHKNDAPVETGLEEAEECKSVPDITTLSESELPNLIALNPTTGSVIDFGVLTNPHHRFMLLGGIQGFFNTMAEFGVQPNIKTFTLLLHVIPPNSEAEENLIALAKTHKIQLDTVFYNMLMKRRFFREEDASIKDCLEQMFSLNLRPDLVTFGVLALGCRSYDQGMDLIKALRNHGYRLNSVILETLLKRAIYVRDMKYVLAVLKEGKEDGTQLSASFVSEVSNFIKREKARRRKSQLSDAEKTDEEGTAGTCEDTTNELCSVKPRV